MEGQLVFRVSYRRREKEGKKGGGGRGRRWRGNGRRIPLPPSLPHLTLGLTADSRQLVWEALERERTPFTVLATGGARCAAVQV